MRVKKGIVAWSTLAAALGVNRLTLTRWARDGRLPVARKNGAGQHQITQADLRKALIPDLPEEKLIPEGWRTVPDAAKELGVSPAALYMSINARKLRAQVFDGVKCVSAEEIARYDRARQVAKEARALRLRIAQLTKTHERLTQQLNGAERPAVH